MSITNRPRYVSRVLVCAVALLSLSACPPTSGSGGGTAFVLGTSETFSATDGAQYLLSIYIDEDGNVEPDTGEQILNEMPKTITVNGDTVVNTVYPGDYMAKP